uniref:Hydroxycarboxylic acid receptor 1 n=1 Tax=Scleropages formosus TaxID=113540 RepID=A0A8C9S9R2_SCLFO
MAQNCCSFEGTQVQLLLPSMLVLEFILGILGNGLALWIFCFHLKPWKSSTVLLFNLALADFFLNIALPFRAHYYQRRRDWIYGDVFCRISLFMLAMNRSGSILFLTTVAVDRYLRVVLPHHPFNSMSVAKAVCVTCGIWAVTISSTAHLLFKPHFIKAGNRTQCESFLICKASDSYDKLHKGVFLTSFYLALVVILFCSIRIIFKLRDRQLDKNSKIKKALHCIVAVVVLFFICFFPSNLTELMILTASFHHSLICKDYEGLEMAFFFTISLTYLNSMLDPIIYYFSSPTFRKIYQKLLMHSKKLEIITVICH